MSFHDFRITERVVQQAKDWLKLKIHKDCSCLLVKQNRSGILIFLAENVFTMLEMNTYWPILKIIWLLSWIVGAVSIFFIE